MVTKEVKYLFPRWNKTGEGICNVYILYSSVEMQGNGGIQSDPD